MLRISVCLCSQVSHPGMRTSSNLYRLTDVQGTTALSGEED